MGKVPDFHNACGHDLYQRARLFLDIANRSDDDIRLRCVPARGLAD